MSSSPYYHPKLELNDLDAQGIKYILVCRGRVAEYKVVEHGVDWLKVQRADGIGHEFWTTWDRIAPFAIKRLK